MPDPSTVLTVDAVCSVAKELLESGLGSVWVRGELSQFTRHRSGHMYATLRGARAQLPFVVWRGTMGRLRFNPESGQELVLHGYVTLYEPQGRFQFIADDVSVAGQGELLARQEALKQALKAEGLFEPARKRPLPLLPRRVGLITSADGAALRDFWRCVSARGPTRVLLAPAAVQGPGAPAALVAGLRQLDAVGGVDVIVLTRGGGSAEDLMAFSDEQVVRAVAACATPVVSAVGHEIDWVLSDLAADERCATPTAAGERVVPSHRDLLTHLDERAELITERVARRLERAASSLAQLERQTRRPDRLVDQLSLRVDDLERAALDGLARRLDGFDRIVARASDRLGRRDPTRLVPALERRVDGLAHRLAVGGERRLGEAEARLREASARLSALDPRAVLARGYSITREAGSGRLLRDADQVAEGALIESWLASGRIESRVTRRVASEEDA
jgi:exodeoxyribonuclease VII large subunit